MGYTVTEGLVLTGQGSTNDVTIKNDADNDVMVIPTGTQVTNFAGPVGMGLARTQGTLHVHQATATGATASAYGNVLVVEDDGHMGMSLLSPNTSVSAIYFGCPADPDAGLIQTSYNGGDSRIQLGAGGGLVFTVTVSNVGIGTTATGASATNTLVIADGTAPTGNVADAIQLYADGGPGSKELIVRDEAGNTTTLSPHDFSLFEPDASIQMPWSYYSKNAFIGKEANIDIAGAIAEVEKLSGKKFIHTNDLPASDVQDWDVEQQKLVDQRDAEIAIATEQKNTGAKVDIPLPHTPKPIPKWIADRKAT